jgi:hypothetical protein
MAIQGNQPTFPQGLQAQLMALPMVPRRDLTGDGTEPTSGKPVQPTQGTTPSDAENGPSDEVAAPQSPTLETCSAALAFQTVDLLVRSQDRLARNRWAIDQYHRAVDDNYPFGRLIFSKQPNQALWEYKTPPGASGRQNPAAVPNKANDLCNKIVDTIEADPAKPNPLAPTNAESADDTAELAGELLRQLGGATALDDSSLWRWSLRNALTAASSFIEYEDTEDGGGWQPYQVLALPGAQDPQQPMVAMDANGITLPPVDPILRYVSATNQFVETADQADRVWLPSIRANRLRREQVRTFPPMAKAHEARAVALLKYCTLQEALDMPGWDSVRQMTQAQLQGLASYRTPYPNMIVPPGFLGGVAEGQSGPSMAQVGSLSPLLQRRMYFLRFYIKPGKSEYQNGLCLDVSGANGGTILKRETMDYTVSLPSEKGTISRCRAIPVVQETPNDDITGMDPMGWPLEARFAGSSEASATLIAAHLDAINQRLHPHVIFRSTTNVDEDDWADRETPIILDPSAQEPSYEQFPPMPDVDTPVEMLYKAMDSAASLGDTAQGLETPTSVSGVSKQITVQQAKIGLSGVQQRHNAAKCRAWMICLQIMQAKFSTPQLIRFSGEDGSDAEQWWTGDDLAGVPDDIGIEPGTGSMLTAESKAQLAAYAQAQQWVTPKEAGKIAMSGIGGDLGTPPDPVEQMIERTVGAVLDGPPKGWMETYASQQQATQAFAVQQQQYAGIAQQAQLRGVLPPQAPVAPQFPPLPSPFVSQPVDTDPTIAQKWVDRLTALIVSPAFRALPDPWKQQVFTFYGQERTVITQTAQAAQQAQSTTTRMSGTVPTQPGQPTPNDQTFDQLKQKIDALVSGSLASLVAKEVSGQMGLVAPQPAPGAPPPEPSAQPPAQAA